MKKNCNILNSYNSIIEHNNITNVNNDTNIIKVIDNNLIQSYLAAIDKKNIEKIKLLFNKINKENIEIDIINEIYNLKELTEERLHFIIENCTSFLNISSCLVTNLM